MKYHISKSIIRNSSAKAASLEARSSVINWCENKLKPYNIRIKHPLIQS